MFTRIVYLAGICLCAVALLGTTQCQNNNNGIGLDGPNFVTTLAVQDANGNATGSFAASQQIQFVLSVRNRSTTTQTVTFNTAQQTNFAVLDSGSATEVWTWSLGQTFAQSQTNLTWQPGETKTFSVTWSQVNDSNQLVAAGNYEAVAGLTCVNPSTSNSSTTAASNCMPAGIPGSADLAPSVYISTLVSLSIQ